MTRPMGMYVALLNNAMCYALPFFIRLQGDLHKNVLYLSVLLFAEMLALQITFDSSLKAPSPFIR